MITAAFATTTIVLFAVCIFFWHSTRSVTTAVLDLHKLINSRMDDWVAAEKAVSRTQGHGEGVIQERVDQRAARKTAIATGDENSEL